MNNENPDDLYEPPLEVISQNAFGGLFKLDGSQQEVPLKFGVDGPIIGRAWIHSDGHVTARFDGEIPHFMNMEPNQISIIVSDEEPTSLPQAVEMKDVVEILETDFSDIPEVVQVAPHPFVLDENAPPYVPPIDRPGGERPLLAEDAD